MTLTVPQGADFIFTNRRGLVIVSIQDLHTIMRAVTIHHLKLKVSEGQSHMIDWNIRKKRSENKVSSLKYKNLGFDFEIMDAKYNQRTYMAPVHVWSSYSSDWVGKSMDSVEMQSPHPHHQLI